MLCIISVYLQAHSHLNGSIHISQQFLKMGAKNLVNNYRPISLLNSVSQILERLVFYKVYPFLIKPNQHGFMRKRSVQSQLISNCNIIGNDLDKGIQNDIIFLDFSTAFDKVPHHLLYCISSRRKKLFKWFTDYLVKKANLLLLKIKSLQTCPSHLVYNKVLSWDHFYLYSM